MKTDCYGCVHVVMRQDADGTFKVDSVWTGPDGSTRGKIRLRQLDGIIPYGKHYSFSVRPDETPIRYR